MLMILCLVLPMATEFVGCSGGGITRSEWIGMLSEQFGLNDYVTKSPVFTDVNQGVHTSRLFSPVQTGKSWTEMNLLSVQMTRRRSSSPF